MNDIDIDAVDRTIRARKTSKIMLDPVLVGDAKAIWTSAHHRALEVMIEGAGWAPFHRRADEAAHRSGEMAAMMPWRFHVLEGPSCISLIEFLEQQSSDNSDPKWSRAWQSKIKNMLAACGALVQVTWLPDPVEQGSEQALTLNNIEHIAAASAAIQNLLLAAEARGWKSYWSSGGILRDSDVFEQLGIGANESLLGSVFLTPDVHEQASVRSGGLRAEHSEIAQWTRWV